jgi:hypothetical protein
MSVEMSWKCANIVCCCATEFNNDSSNNNNHVLWANGMHIVDYEWMNNIRKSLWGLDSEDSWDSILSTSLRTVPVQKSFVQ